MADLDDIKDGKDFHTDTPQRNTPFTLKGCGALDWGMQSRLSRIFNPETGRTVMLAFDHGYFQGPTTGLERISPPVPARRCADVHTRYPAQCGTACHQQTGSPARLGR